MRHSNGGSTTRATRRATRRARAATAPLALAAVVAATACGSSGASGPAASTTDAPAAAAKVPGADLAGRYAHYDVVAYESADMKTLIVSFGFTDLSVRDGELWAEESFCHADHRSDQPIQSTISDAATQAIKPKATPVEVTADDGAVSFHRPETPTGIGIRLADPANDVLPTDPADPRVADDDNDGKPGITVSIAAGDSVRGELYIARRERFAYDVTEQPDGSLVGTVTDKSEQLIVGASDPVFITRAEWVQHPDLDKSPIILRPVDDDWDCDRLMAARDDLFPPTPSVDW